MSFTEQMKAEQKAADLEMARSMLRIERKLQKTSAVLCNQAAYDTCKRRIDGLTEICMELSQA
jgi:hypothetical protein